MPKGMIFLKKRERNNKMSDYWQVWNFGFKKIFLIIIVFLLSLTLFKTSALATEYDGIWFLGFNVHKDLLSNQKIREIIFQSINRKKISKEIVKSEVMPNSIIPPDMLGSYKSLNLDYDLKTAKETLKSLGFSMNDKRLKNLELLHTDGDITQKIAKAIKKDLSSIGIGIKLVEVKYAEPETWVSELSSGKYHMFLMGYKANPFLSIFIGDTSSKIFHLMDCEKVPLEDKQVLFSSYDDAIKNGFTPDTVNCHPKNTGKTETEALLRPLFYSKGDANFTFYSNINIDNLLDQLAQIDSSMKEEQLKKIQEINKRLSNDLPIIPLFYIEKL
ncbi:hypothetical protein A2526_02350 [candidate division WOR-1 bacterium RIFOXYD2_FULL_36_8]|nr:MAG: hypothetical protein A2526_02350 [candidate division WOR-1 bacterium RIFOXYD2_FULL_36_8]